MGAKTDVQHIVSTPGVAGGKPRIDGGRITVQNIVVWHEQMGYSVDEIATLYDLTLAQIYAALAYYYDHKQEIDQSIAQGEVFADTLRAKTPSRVAQKLYARTG
ncbi:MAG: DUF433 domain-containing protein [Litorilinea sp.]